jgi:hypothetical protein
VSAPKMADVVCAHNFFKQKRTKPILQVTVAEVDPTTFVTLVCDPNCETARVPYYAIVQVISNISLVARPFVLAVCCSIA